MCRNKKKKGLNLPECRSKKNLITVKETLHNNFNENNNSW